MPKPMEILIQVEEGHFGKVWRTLDTMPGVALIQYKSEGVKGQKAPTKKQGGTQSSECIVLDCMIRAARPAPRSVLAAALVTGGRKASTIAGVMNSLIKKKHATAVSGRGTPKVTYSVTAAGKKRFETACTISKE